MRYFWSKLFAVACVASGCAVAVAAPLHDDRPVVRIGLVDTFSPEFYINTYAATVQYLKRNCHSIGLSQLNLPMTQR